MPGFYHTVARFYDLENSDKTDDIELYLELAEEYGGPIMDIGAGSGRVMIPLARQGYEVHGIDNEQAMLDKAAAYRQSLPDLERNMHLHLGDVRTYALDTQFKLMLVPYNGMMHFHTQEDQLTVLKQLRKWMLPDGLLVLDLPNAGEVFATQDSDGIMLERTFLDPETGHVIMQQSHSILDRVEQLLKVTWIYDELAADGAVHRTFAPLILYYYFYAEIKLLLQLSNFEVESVYGDTDLSPYEDGCERMVIFARPV